MSYITTGSGIHFDPMEPDKNLIEIKDIAHSLSLMCRANGHFREFYSVAQHSLACALEAEYRGYSERVIMGCLLHDASEAYLSDITRPVKAYLDFYMEVEDRLQDVIWKKYMGSCPDAEERKQIFEIDDQMLSMEFHQLMPEDVNDDYRHLERKLSCIYEDPGLVEKEYLDMFDRLQSEFMCIVKKDF